MNEEYDDEEYEQESNYLMIQEEGAKLMDQEGLYLEFQSKLKQVEELIGTSQQNSLNLLIFYNFDSKVLERDYLVEENQQILIKNNMIEQGIFSQSNIEIIQDISCPICLTQITEGLQLQCGHCFCVSCWKQMIDVQFANFIPIIKCLQDQCVERMPHKYLEQYDQYKKILIKRLMYNDKSITWCPGLGCESVFKCLNFQRAVKCSCGIKFCSKCRNEKHYPIPCDILKRYLRFEESNDHWVSLHTTKCPNCGRFIQRTEGCNHLKCYCQQHFCFVCGKPWGKDHEKSFYDCPYKNTNEILSLKAKDMVKNNKFFVYRQRCFEKKIKIFSEAFIKIKMNSLFQPFHQISKLMSIQRLFAFYKYFSREEGIDVDLDADLFENQYIKFENSLEALYEKFEELLIKLDDQEADKAQLQTSYESLPENMKKELQSLRVQKQILCDFILKQIQ